MKKIIFLLLGCGFMLSCNEKTPDAKPDTISIQLSGTGITAKDAGDGNWLVVIPEDFDGDIALSVTSSQTWGVDVSYLNGAVDWVTPGTIGGNSTLLSVTPNIAVEKRRAIVKVVTRGEVPSYKTISLVQSDSEPFVEFEPEDDVEYDPDERLLGLGYNGAIHEIGIFTNITNLSMELVRINEGDDISWITGFSYNDNGTVGFTAKNNFTGTDRSVGIHVESGTYSQDFTMTQEASLYRNVLLSVDGESSPAAILSGCEYGISVRNIVLAFDADQPLKAEVIDPATSAAATWARASVSGGNVTVSADRNSGAQRRAEVRVKASSSSFEEQNPVVWTLTQKEEAINVEWKGGYVTLTDGGISEKLIFGQTARTVTIADVTTTDDDWTFEQPAGGWATLSKDGSKLQLTLTGNAGGDDPRTTTVKVKNVNGAAEKSIRLEQYSSASAISKSGWTVSRGNSNTTAYPGNEYVNLIDGNADTYWEWSWSGTDADLSMFPSVPYQFVIDMRGTRNVNCFEVHQCHSKHNSCIKQVSYEISADGNRWTHLGIFNMSSSSADCETYGEIPYIHELENVAVGRYVRFSILSNVGGSVVNNSKNATCAEISMFFK